MFGITAAAADRCVARLMRWIRIFPLCYFKYIAFVSWNWLVIGNLTIGLDGGILKILWIWQFSDTSLISSFNFSFLAHNSPALFISLRSFSDDGRANCWRHFTAIYLLLLLLTTLNVICLCPILPMLSIRYSDFVIGRA